MYLLGKSEGDGSVTWWSRRSGSFGAGISGLWSSVPKRGFWSRVEVSEESFRYLDPSRALPLTPPLFDTAAVHYVLYSTLAYNFTVRNTHSDRQKIFYNCYIVPRIRVRVASRRHFAKSYELELTDSQLVRVSSTTTDLVLRISTLKNKGIMWLNLPYDPRPFVFPIFQLHSPSGLPHHTVFKLPQIFTIDLLFIGVPHT